MCYINKTYNLQWDLSGAKWRIAEDYRLPKDMIFAQLCKMISLAFLYVHFNLKKNWTGIYGNILTSS